MAESAPVTLRDRLLSLALVAGVIFALWFFVLRGDGGSNAPEPLRAQSYIEEHGGEIGVIQVILAHTDCDVLARTFDAAKSNFDAFGAGTARGKEQLGRMDAALDRMDELACDG